MCRNRYLFLFINLFCLIANAQLDSIQKLDEVVLTDSKLYTFSKGYIVERITLQEREKNQSLTEVLRFNSLIYFKENGFGMVSSPSFRGTNASHTAVVWNGININSHFTGQTDFNVISPVSYDEISIRSGGGGVQYGSGAIGGTVHLNNNFSFGEKSNQTKIRAGYGSFETYQASGDYTFRNENYFLNAGIGLIDSKNDYRYIGKNQINEHGEFSRLNVKINAARRFKNSSFSWNSEYVNNDRNFSGSLTTIGKDGYQDVHTRNLIRFQQRFGMINITTRVGHLYEAFRYFPNTAKTQYDSGKAQTWIGNTEAETFFCKDLKLNGKLEYTFIQGHGINTGKNHRNNFAAILLLNHNFWERLDYGIHLRQEFNGDFENPFLISADAKYKVSTFYNIRLNASKNYRVPTFNDLFWNAGGNPDLDPEKSYQVEVGQEWVVRNFSVDIAAFFISSRDMIKWIPINSTIWSPVNIVKAENKGLEISGNYSYSIKEFGFLKLRFGYAYTDAQDLEKKKQLMYVPFHSGNAALTLETNKFNFSSSLLYNGKVFDRTDNTSTVKAYDVVNVGAEYLINQTFRIGVTANNIFDKYYENVAYRPMPSRNFQFYINLNI